MEKEKLDRLIVIITNVEKILYLLVSLFYLVISIILVKVGYDYYYSPQQQENKYNAYVFAPSLLYFISFFFTLYCGILINKKLNWVAQAVVLLVNVLLMRYMLTHWNWNHFIK